MASSLSLTAVPTSVAAGDLNGDGKLDLVITKKASGNVTVLLGNGNGGFSAGVDYAAAKLAGNVVLADLNGDGRLDVAVTDTASGAIDVLFGNGDGTLRAPVTYAAQSNPLALALGNFTGRGKIDLAVASANGLSILLNDGGGNFTAAASVPLSGSPQSLTASDLRGTGRDDLALANQNGTVTVLLGNGSGSFNTQPALSVGAGSLSAVVAGDFNGDGKPDLAVSAASSNTVAVLLGHGDGSFAPAVAYTVGNSPASLVAADLRSNGITDLVSVNQAANTFSVLLGNGDGTFGPSSDFVAGNSPIALAAADFNGDGHADLAIVNSGSATIAVPLGRGDGTFVASRAYRADLERKAIASGDLNGDGHSDLVVTNFCGGDPSCASAGTATVFLAQIDGTYKAASTITLGNGPVAVALADLNGDKKLDLLALNQTDKSLMVMLGNGDGTFGSAQLYTLSASPSALYVADFNGDGKPDLAIASDCGQTTCSQPGSLDIWLGHGDGSLAASTSYTVGYSPISIAAGDLRGTGHPDLIVANACGDTGACTGDGTGSLLANDGTGKFTQMGEVDLGPSPSSIALGNLSGNGLDLAVAQRTSNQIAVLHANGSGGFGAPVTYSVGTAPSALTIADFNGDGNQDVAVANFQSSTVSVLYGTGAGALGSTTTYPVSSGPDAMVAVAPISGHISSLVTTNGDTGATPMGNGITALGGSDPGSTASTTALAVGGPGSSALNASVTLTATVTGTTTSPSGTVTFTSTNTTTNVTQTINDCNGSPGPAGLTTIPGATETATCATQSLQAGIDSLVAYYSGDPTYEASNSASTSVTQTVSQGTTTLAVASSSANNTSSVGQAVTYTASVTPFNGPVALSGSVTFTDNSNPLTCSPAVNGDATGTFTCTTTYTAPGTHAISATYGSDSNYSGSSGSLSPSQTVTTGVTTTSVTSVPGGPVALGTSVTFTAVVTLPAGATTAPTGSIVFTDNGNSTALCTVSIPSSSPYQVNCVTSSLTGGSHTIVATYSGDGNYATSSGSATLTVTVGSGTSSTSVSSSSNPSTVGQQVTFTATISASGGAFAPTGTVNFQNNGVTIAGCGIAGISSTAPYQATCTTTFTTVGGAGTITAIYSGDANYGTSSGNVIQMVNPGSTTTILTASPNPSNVGQQVVLTATIALPLGATVAPTGTVTITGCGSVSISSTAPYVASCTSTLMATGSNTLTATYSGDSNYASSSSGNLTQTVDQAATSVVVSPSPSSPTLNQQVVFTATVMIPSGATTAPTGTVTFTDDNTPISVCGGSAGVTLTASTAPYQVTCTVPSLTATGHTIVATYSGDTNYKSSFGNVGISLNGISTTTTVSAAPNPSIVNQAVTFTVNVQGSTTVQLTGTATVIADGANDLGRCAPSWDSTTGLATCTVSNATLGKGTHPITVSYSGDANYNPSSTGTPVLQQTVNADTTTLTLTASPSSSTVNQPVTLTATIGFTSGSTPITGTVAFTDNSTPIAGCSSVAPSSTGVAICTDTSLTAGSHPIAASYTGDSNFGGSNAASISQSVTQGQTTSLTLSSNLPPPQFVQVNAPVTFTATLTYPSGGVPLTGAVAFTDSVTSAAIPNCSAQALAIGSTAGTAIATCTTSTLAFGSHTITAAYTDSANNFSPITSSPIAQSVGAAPISMTLSASATTGTVNQATPITFSAIITAPSGTTSLTGKVAFTDTINTTTTTIAICSAVAPSADGTSGGNSLWLAQCSGSTLTAGSHAIAAKYTGDTNFGNTSASGVTVTLTPATTSVAITSAPNPSSLNQSVTFTATVSAPTGGIALSGTVSFTDSVTAAAIPCSASTPLTNGVATCTTSTLAFGAHNITATYTDTASNFLTSTSPQLAQTVGVAATTTTLIANPTSATFNTPVTFTATVSSAAQGGTAFSGTMAFTDNGSTIPGCGTAAVNGTSGVATCVTSTLPAGADTIIAAYSNDKNFGGSTASLTEQVAAASATITLAPATPAPILAVNPKGTNDSVTFTASIFPAYSGAVPLSGTIVFTDTITSNGTTSSAPICKVAPSSSGVAVCTCPSASCALPSGQNTITASYTGDPNLTPAPSAAVSQLVEDYSLVVSSAPPVAVTQGFTTSNDLFSSQTISVAPVSISSFTTASGQPLTLTCAVTAIAPATGATAPLCTLGGSSLVVAASGTPEPTDSIVIDATKATAGTYSVTLNATDPTTGLAHSSTAFNVVVRGVDGPLTLVSGATTGNTASVSFLLPAGVSLSNIACSFAAGPNLSSMVAPSSLSIGCSFSPTTIAASGSQQNGTTTATITTGTTTSSLAGHSSLLFAGVLGIPLFGVFGLLRGRRSLGATLLRLLAIAMIGAAAFQAMGCGGSFQRSTATGGGQTPPGAYDLLITGKGSDGNTYQTVLSLNVTL